jgi:hypothetical protein
MDGWNLQTSSNDTPGSTEADLVRPTVFDSTEANHQGWQADQLEAAAQRRAAAKEIIDAVGPESLLALARGSKMPGVIGAAIAESGLDDVQKDALLRQCLKGDEAMVAVARGILIRRSEEEGIAWSHALIERAAREDWPTDQIVTVALTIPASRALWDKPCD